MSNAVTISVLMGRVQCGQTGRMHMGLLVGLCTQVCGW